MIDLTKFTTETRNATSNRLDEMSPLEIVSLMNQADVAVIQAVNSQLPQIAQVASWATQALYDGGRIIYLGAGTSGRLGVLDAVECPPTFGIDYDKVIGLIAGGDGAFVKAKEGAEDSQTLAQEDLLALKLNATDLVIGIAASGRTPYVIGGLSYAKQIGCKTAAIACNADSAIGKIADCAIEAVTGPEILTGSTRLKAGTAQKMILNMISTTAMIGYGKVYQNLMVDVKQSNQKLIERAINIVIQATQVSRDVAIDTLAKAQGHVKTAIVMILHHVNFTTALALLEEAKGHIKQIKKETGNDK